MRRRPLPLILAVVLSSASGCAHLTSDVAGSLMVQAPNRIDPRIRTAYRKPPEDRSEAFDQRFWVSVGPPAAQLLVSVIEARPQGSPAVGTILVTRSGDDIVLDWSADSIAATSYAVYLLSGTGLTESVRAGTTFTKSFVHAGAALPGADDTIIYRITAVDACGQESTQE